MSGEVKNTHNRLCALIPNARPQTVCNKNPGFTRFSQYLSIPSRFFSLYVSLALARQVLSALWSFHLALVLLAAFSLNPRLFPYGCYSRRFQPLGVLARVSRLRLILEPPLRLGAGSLLSLLPRPLCHSSLRLPLSPCYVSELCEASLIPPLAFLDFSKNPL